MAKGVYDKKRPTAKKVSNFDSKIIIIVSIAVVVVVAGILAALIINTATSSYVGSVDGTKISVFDYRLFLDQTKSEMQSEASENDENYDSTTFWTAEKIKEAEEKALEDVREFYAEYLLAKKNGFALSKAEKNQYSTNVINAIQYYKNYQYPSYTLDQVTTLMTGANVKYDEINEFVQYAVKSQAISNYKTSISEKLNVEDLRYIDEDTEKVVSKGEQAIKDEYEANKVEYRRIELAALAISKGGSKPTEPTAVEEPVKPETEDETSTEYVEYKTKLEEYNTYLTKKAEYEEKLKTWEEENKKTAELVETIYQALLNDGKYSGKGIKELDTGEKDADGNAIKEVAVYEDATFEDIIAKEGEQYDSDMNEKGVTLFYGEPSKSNLMDVFAESIDWTDDTRTAVASDLLTRWAKEEDAEEAADSEEKTETEADADADKSDDDKEDEDTDPWAEYNNDYTLESVTEDGKFKETKLILIQDGSYYYIVKCINIYDLENSTEEEPSEDEADENTILSVRAVVIRVLKTATTNDMVKDTVKDAGTKYAVTGKNDKNIAKASEKVFGTAS